MDLQWVGSYLRLKRPRAAEHTAGLHPTCLLTPTTSVLDASMRNVWPGTQKEAVGRATGSPSATELDQYHGSPDLAHRLLLFLKPTKFVIIMAIPVGR